MSPDEPVPTQHNGDQQDWWGAAEQGSKPLAGVPVPPASAGPATAATTGSETHPPAVAIASAADPAGRRLRTPILIGAAALLVIASGAVLATGHRGDSVSPQIDAAVISSAQTAPAPHTAPSPIPIPAPVTRTATARVTVTAAPATRTVTAKPAAPTPRKSTPTSAPRVTSRSPTTPPTNPPAPTTARQPSPAVLTTPPAPAPTTAAPPEPAGPVGATRLSVNASASTIAGGLTVSASVNTDGGPVTVVLDVSGQPPLTLASGAPGGGSYTRTVHTGPGVITVTVHASAGALSASSAPFTVKVPG